MFPCLDVREVLNYIVIFLSLRCSSKKYNSNAPVGQPTAGNWNVDSTDSSTARAVQNGAHPTHSKLFVFGVVVNIIVVIN